MGTALLLQLFTIQLISRTLIRIKPRVFLPVLCNTRTGSMIIHLRAAVGAEYESRQGIGFIDGIETARRFNQALTQLPGLQIDEGLLGTLEYRPFFGRILDVLFLLVGLACGTEIDRITEIIRLGQNLLDHIAAPIVGIENIEMVLVFAYVPLGMIVAGGFNMLVS